MDLEQKRLALIAKFTEELKQAETQVLMLRGALQALEILVSDPEPVVPETTVT